MAHPAIPPTEATLGAAVERRLRERMAQAAPAPNVAETIALARAAVRKVDQMGPRGITLVTMQEIEAMALMLVVLGLKPYAQNGD